MRYLLNENFNRVQELVLKDLKLRYQRPALGFLWAFLSPLFLVLIFYIVFGIVLKVEIPGVPFVLYLMTGVFSWVFFQDSVLKSLSSLVDNKNLIREANFPHYLIPISITLANGIVFLPSLMIVIFSAAILLEGLPAFLVFLPIVLLAHLTITILLAIVFSVLYVRWRDLRYIVESVLMFFFYITPIVYHIELIRRTFSAWLYRLYICNPFLGILDLYRICLLRNFYPVVDHYVGLRFIFIQLFVFIAVIAAGTILIYQKNKKKINDYLAY